MKKLSKIFAVVLVCALTVTALVACAPKPNLNYDEAQKNLSENDYYVTAAKNGEENFENAATGLVQVGISADDIDCIIVASKKTHNMDLWEFVDSITIAWFKTEEAAIDAYDKYEKNLFDLKEWLDNTEADLDAKKDTMDEEAYQEALAEYEFFEKSVDMPYGVSGNVFWGGTSAAINATK